MAPLASELRRDLERAVLQAREAAERGAWAALQVLAVDADRAFDTMSPTQRSQRVALRARMRALAAADTSYQGVAGSPPKGWTPLVEEVAYEQWHRMLFARFLEQNNLLIHPNHGVSVSLDECADVATAEGEPDEWMVAAKFASEMLPGIFRPDELVARVRFAPNDRTTLERVLLALPAELFGADDALGWVYQFWQSDRKKSVNKKGGNIGPADLPAVTQLFTEDYMVRFLLENSLGAWWAASHPESPLVARLTYLRHLNVADGSRFAGWPTSTAEITVIDPCCGSGHFLTVALELLTAMRMEEEGLDSSQAGDAVIRDNLFGLELDPRCTQIAAFAIALAAWKDGGYRKLPLPNIACSGIAAVGSLADWNKLARGDERLQQALTALHEQFAKAPALGSLIDPRRATDQGHLFSIDYDLVAPLFEKLLEREDDPEARVAGWSAAGLARAASLLARTYSIVVTNVPYLGRGAHHEALADFCDRNYPLSKSDLATVFLERIRRMTAEGGVYAVVTPQNWYFLASYEALRVRLLTEQDFVFAVPLGERAFESHAAAGAFVAMTIALNRSPVGKVALLECGTGASASAKRTCVKEQMPMLISQSELLASPNSRIVGGSPDMVRLGEYAKSYQGLKTGDNGRFTRLFWEVPIDQRWARLQTSVDETVLYGGRSHVLLWEGGAGALARSPQARVQGSGAWGRAGVIAAEFRDLPATLYMGDMFDSTGAAIVPESDALVPALWAYCKSGQFTKAARQLDRKVSIATATLTQVSFDREYWQRVAGELFPNGLPKPHSDDPTQWICGGNVKESDAPLQVAVARLLGYRWPDQEATPMDVWVEVDGILPLSSVPTGKEAAERLRASLAAAYGSEWSPGRLEVLLADVGYTGKSLAGWLRDGFFEQHCKLFHQRPFIWQIWDGRGDGFSALVNYHLLGRAKLEKLAYHYLGSWLERQRDQKNNGIPGADDRLAAAQALQKKLGLILEGEPPHDIFVRWKQDHEQALGWDPDLDDGVRVNIRPFVAAGVLRWKPNIKWDKDRGKNPGGGDRVNDRNLTIAAKREARLRAAVPV